MYRVRNRSSACRSIQSIGFTSDIGDTEAAKFNKVLTVFSRDGKRKQINSNRVVYPQSNFLQCRKKRSEMQHRDMADTLILFSQDWFTDSGIFMVCFGCMDGLVGWRWSCFLHWNHYTTVLRSKDRYSIALSSLWSTGLGLPVSSWCYNFVYIPGRLNKA